MEQSDDEEEVIFSEERESSESEGVSSSSSSSVDGGDAETPSKQLEQSPPSPFAKMRLNSTGSGVSSNPNTSGVSSVGSSSINDDIDIGDEKVEIDWDLVIKNTRLKVEKKILFLTDHKCELLARVLSMILVVYREVLFVLVTFFSGGFAFMKCLGSASFITPQILVCTIFTSLCIFFAIKVSPYFFFLMGFVWVVLLFFFIPTLLGVCGFCCCEFGLGFHSFDVHVFHGNDFWRIAGDIPKLIISSTVSFGGVVLWIIMIGYYGLSAVLLGAIACLVLNVSGLLLSFAGCFVSSFIFSVCVTLPDLPDCFVLLFFAWDKWVLRRQIWKEERKLVMKEKKKIRKRMMREIRSVREWSGASSSSPADSIDSPMSSLESLSDSSPNISMLGEMGMFEIIDDDQQNVNIDNFDQEKERLKNLISEKSKRKETLEKRVQELEKLLEDNNISI